MSKWYSFNEATVRITKSDGERLAIFDVSRTVKCLWIAVSNREGGLLEVIGSTRDMLKFVARKQIKGAEVVGDDGFLDREANNEGFDSWAEWIDDLRAELEPPEFPIYYDAQGREHAEF